MPAPFAGRTAGQHSVHEMKQTTIDRRTLLRGALGAAAGAALAPYARLRAAEALRVTQVSATLSLVAGAGGNVLVRSMEDGQALVDSGAAGETSALREALAGLPGGGRVRTLFNTHWHRDQVGGNAAFGADGATIIAHEKTRVRLETAYFVGPREDGYEPPLPASGHVTEPFYVNGATTLDGEPVEYGYLLEAHTDGDAYVFFRGSNVVAVGGAVSPARDPSLDWFGGGWLGGRIDSLELLLALGDAGTRFVPSYGPVVGRADVQAERDLMMKIYDVLFEYVRKGYGAEDILAEGLLDSVAERFDDLPAFVYAAHKGLWAHHNTLSPDIV